MIRYILFLLFIGLSFTTKAQKTTQSSDSTENKVVLKKISTTPTPVMDTDESLKYMGGLLLFEVKKRLNLTSKDEELAAAKEKSKKVRLSIGGIVIER